MSKFPHWPLTSFILTAFATAAWPSAAPADTACVLVESHEPALAFAGQELRLALRQKGWEVSAAPAGSSVTIILARPDGEGEAESFDVSPSQDGGPLTVRVRGKDVRGVMYGGLDLAEQIALGQEPTNLQARRGAPYLSVRGLKFNIPLPGTQYISQEEQDHSDWFFDLDFWRDLLRFLAYHRYNLLTFWSAHPFDRMVRLDKYPEANSLTAEELDRNIAFFHQLFAMARDCGIDTSVVTWNIHCSPGFRKAHGVQDGQDSPLIRDYQKECVKALLTEYPALTGVGTCPGEFMLGTAQWRADWIRATYLAGVAESGRQNVPFILRYWGGEPAPTARMLTEAQYPGPMYLDIKYNGEHMYSSPAMHVQEREWLTQEPRPYKLLWHLRNDCIFQLRWGDPDFAAATVRNCGGPDSAGFVMGSEIEVPGVDRIHTSQAAPHMSWKYEFEKNWFRFGVWGRLGYNPDEPHEYWIAHFAQRFGSQAAPAAFAALQSASRIIPLTTSFHWNYMNGDWYPEANIGDWNTSHEVPFPNYRDQRMFHDVLEWIFTHTIDDSLQGIPDYVADRMGNGSLSPVQSSGQAGPPSVDSRLLSADVLTPPKVADLLDAAAADSERQRRAATGKVSSGQDEWECTAMDLQALEALGRYYAAKIRGATELMFFLATGEEPRRAAAIQHLEQALVHWKDLAAVTVEHYIPHEIFLFGQFDWQRYTPDAERDIQIAREIAPWVASEQSWEWGSARTAVKSRAWLPGDRPLPGLARWVEAFNARAARLSAGSAKPQEGGDHAATLLRLDKEGISILGVRSSGLASARINGTDCRITGEAPNQFIIGPVRSGDNRVTLTFAPRATLLPFVTQHAALDKDSLFIEAESGQLSPPMAIRQMPGASGGKAVWAPKDKGRGDENGGHIIDNGWVTYQVEIPRDGDYRIHASVLWTGTAGNSFFYAWNDAAPRILGNEERYHHWLWTRTQPTKLAAGTHTLTIRNREETSAIDCLLIAAEQGP